MDAQAKIKMNQNAVMKGMTPVPHPSTKFPPSQSSLYNNQSMPQMQVMPAIGGLPSVHTRSIDDQELNVRLTELNEKKNSIALMARKYDLEDNSSIERLSLLSLRNNKRNAGRTILSQDR